MSATRTLLLVALNVGSALQAQRPTAREVNALLDSTVPAAIAGSHVPGVVVAIVRRDSVLALRGFGFARLEDSVRADPARSIYRLASVAKLFVAATVLERVHDGKLDLARAVTAWTPDVVPDSSSPISLRHLLTHTAGFDERAIGYAARSREAMRPLGEYLAARIPDRGWAPGALVAYSNHGMALAGYVAERESGEPFASLAARTVFAPLGMTRTFYIEPPDASLVTDLAPGYRCGESGCERAPVVWSHAYPVGLAFSTASDMSRFMLVWLNGGIVDGQQVLDPRTMDAALQRQFSHHDAVPGMGFAFFEQFYRGRQLFTHAGGVPGTATVLALAPAESLGVFIATNAGEPTVTRSILDAVLSAMVPDEAPARAPVATGPVAEYAGTWRLARYSHRTVERFAGVFAFSIGTYARGDTLFVPAGTTTRRFVRVDSLALQEVHDGMRASLRRDDSGRLTHLFTGLPTGGSELPGAFERAPWYEAPYFLNEYASWLLMLMPLALVLWGVIAGGTWLWRRRRGVATPRARHDAGARQAAILLAVVTAGLFLVFGFGFVAAGTRDLARGQGMAYGMSATEVVLLRLAWAIALAALPIAWFASRAWSRRWWSMSGRLCYSVVAIGAVAAAHFMVWWEYIPGRW